MAFAVFGPGVIVITRTDIANQTPYNIGHAQEFSLSEKAENKKLYGQYQYPLAVANSTKQASGKMKAAQISGMALNAAVWGLSFSAGSLALAQGEAATVPSSGGYTVTVANSAQFDSDLGVLFAASGLPLKKVASAPATGEYAVASGTYTFAATDAGKELLFNYAYKTTGGQTLQVTNQLIGTTPTFQIDYYTTFQGKTYGVRVFKAISSSFSQQFKLSDFMLPELDFEVAADSAGHVYNAYFPEVS